MLKEKSIKSKSLNHDMTELQGIAKELDRLVDYWTYEDDNGKTIESLAYRDSNSMVSARDDSKGEYGKIITWYCISEKLLQYLNENRNSNMQLSFRIVEKLKGTITKPSPEGGERYYGECFAVSNFSELPDLIKLHDKLRLSLI